jgi:hypothetical protein
MASVLLTLIAPACHPEPWNRQEFDLAIDADLRAVVLADAPVGSGAAFLAFIVGDGGVIVRHDGTTPIMSRPTAATLHGIATTEDHGLFAVGDAGVLLGSDDGAHWVQLSADTEAALWAVASVPIADTAYVFAAGDDVLLVRDDVTGEWRSLDAPESGWGDLRAIGGDGVRVYVAGREGVAWSAIDPLDPWSREAVATSADLFAVGVVPGDSAVATPALLLAGAGGTIRLKPPVHGVYDPWEAIDSGVSEDLIALAGRHLLAADGRVFDTSDLVSTHELTLEVDAPLTARALAVGLFDLYDEMIVVGDDGAADRFNRFVPH